jgi:hypothetical protein
MSIVPTGSPAWVRNADHTVYGGDTNKVNFHSQGVVNARTDLGAEALCRLAEDLSAAVRTAPFCIITVQCNDGGSPAAPTVLAVNQMTGVRVVTYAGATPPAGFPSVARNGNGDVTFKWDAAYTDDYGVSGDVHIVHADVGISGSVALSSAWQLLDNDSNGLNESVRVKVFDTAGAAAVSPMFTLTVTTGSS